MTPSATSPVRTSPAGTAPTWQITRHADIRTVLTDERYAVPAPPPADRPDGIAALRGHVARFSTGPSHRRRRGHVEADLRALDPAGLRRDAHQLTRTILDQAVTAGHLDVMTHLARTVPGTVLASRLGADDPRQASDATVRAAAGYHPDADEQRHRHADEAVRRLAALLPSAPYELVANRIGLLIQACDATAALIGNTVHHALRQPADRLATWTTEAILTEVLRYEPPVRLTRRVCRTTGRLAGVTIGAGDHLLLRLDTANRDPAVFPHPEVFDPTRDNRAVLTFGHGPHGCPGDRHTLALAAGVIDALRHRCRSVDPVVDHEPTTNLRIPRSLVVRLV